MFSRPHKAEISNLTSDGTARGPKTPKGSRIRNPHGRIVGYTSNDKDLDNQCSNCAGDPKNTIGGDYSRPARRNSSNRGGTLKMNVRSGRIVVGAIGLELALIIVLVPLLSRVQMSILLPLSAMVVSVFGFAWGWWVGRRLQGWYVFHATATGILATLMYLALCLMNPQGGIRSVVAMYGPFFFVSGNLLRILACAAGGYLYQVRKKG